MIAALPRPHSKHRHPDAGVTLIEVLVVLAVIGVATGAAMLGVAATDRGAGPEAAAVRLARHLSLAVDEALIGGQPLALIWDARGYGFVIWSAATGDWQPAPGLLAVRHDLRAPLELALDGADAPQPVLITPAGTGPARAFTLAPASQGAGWGVVFDGFSATATPGSPA